MILPDKAKKRRYSKCPYAHDLIQRLVAEVEELEGQIETQRDTLQSLRQDVLGYSHDLAEFQTRVETDLLMSEERMLKAIAVQIREAFTERE